MYIHRALQYWQNVLTEFSYLLINFWHLSLTFKLGIQRNWHSLINSTCELLNNFMHIRLYVKSRECRSPLLIVDTIPYKRMGIHFLVIRSNSLWDCSENLNRKWSRIRIVSGCLPDCSQNTVDSLRYRTYLHMTDVFYNLVMHYHGASVSSPVM